VPGEGTGAPSGARAVPLYPVALAVRGRRCLVVGGGRVAARKVAGLLACGAAVTMVAPEAHEALGVLWETGAIAAIDGAPLDVQLRRYLPGEAAGYRLVVAATGDEEVDASVHRDAEEAGVWVNSADDPEHCSFVLPAVWRAGPVTVAVSSGALSPALAAWVRDRLAESLGPELGTLAELVGEARRRLQARGLPSAAVDWVALLEGPLPELVRRAELAEARRLLDAVVDSAE
jgi:siroheme synthase-like protein